jgi:hypothetical protein
VVPTIFATQVTACLHSIVLRGIREARSCLALHDIIEWHSHGLYGRANPGAKVEITSVTEGFTRTDSTNRAGV